MRHLAATVSLLFFLSLTGCEGLGVRVGDDAYRSEGPGQGPPPWAPAHGYRAKHRYRYYPDAEVYYDESRGVYIYYGNGQWRVSASLPAGVRIDFGEYVTLDMDTDRPYDYHGEVVKHYPPGQAKKKSKGKGKWK